MSKKLRAIMGKNCVREVITNQPDRIEQLFVASDALLDEYRSFGFPVKKTSKQRLYELTGSESHQSIVAHVSEKQKIHFKDFLEKTAKQEASLLLFLDSIFDPQNLGAILRTSECFGVDAVIWSSHRGASLTSVVSKASVGASELLTTIQVSNLVSAIKACQKAGYWTVAAELSSKAQSLYDYKFPRKCALIMGSEGTGVRQLTSKQSDDHIMIPMHGSIDSLNVSQATAVILSHWRKQ